MKEHTHRISSTLFGGYSPMQETDVRAELDAQGTERVKGGFIVHGGKEGFDESRDSVTLAEACGIDAKYGHVSAVDASCLA